MRWSEDFSYAQARAQARFSGLLDDREWNRLAAARSLSAYLEEARETGIRPWVAAFSAASDSHDIERGIRAQFRLCVAEAADWAPAAWRPAIAWVDRLADLPLLGHLSARRPLPAWARQDPFLRPYLAPDAGLNHAALAQAGVTPLLEAAQDGDLLDAWLQSWRQKWPSDKADFIRNLNRLTQLLKAHHSHFPLLAPEQAWPARDGLRTSLRHLFHRYLLQPANLFVFISLVACDLERLRRALISRTLYPVPETP